MKAYPVGCVDCHVVYWNNQSHYCKMPVYRYRFSVWRDGDDEDGFDEACRMGLVGGPRFAR